jgi:predicted secreted protein
MPSNAFAGVGTQFKRGTGATAETFVAIAEVNSINGPGMEKQQIEVTSLDSTGGWREYIGGFKDGGELTLEMNFTYASYDILFGDFEDTDSHNYQIALSDTTASTFAFAGVVTGCPISVTADDKVTATITIKLTGPVTLTA